MTVIAQAEKAGTISGWVRMARLPVVREGCSERDHLPSGRRIALVRPMGSPWVAWEWAVWPLSGGERRGLVPIERLQDEHGFGARQRAMDLADEALAAILVEAEERAAEGR